MAAREQAVDATRRRIVDAAIALHARHGVLATNWEEIAERAGVSTATVYRHFPSLEELIPACARSAFEAGAQLPSPEQAATAFARLPVEAQASVLKPNSRAEAEIVTKPIAGPPHGTKTKPSAQPSRKPPPRSPFGPRERRAHGRSMTARNRTQPR